MALAETIGADGRRLFERVSAETGLACLAELEAVETLRRVWIQHSHAREQGTAWRADDELPPSALLITSPSDIEARYSRKKSTAWTGDKVHFTETCEDDEPHFIVEVVTTDATTPDGSVIEELHEDEAAQEILPQQRPDEQTSTALQKARKRQETPAFWTRYAKRAGSEGTVAQAVRTCEMRQARSIGSKKLRLQAFFTATAINVLRACAWLTEGAHASPPVSRFAKLIASAKAAAAA